MPKSSFATSKPIDSRPFEEGLGVVESVALKKEPKNRHDGGERVANSTSLSADLANTWLAWQCQMVTGIIRAALYLPVDAEYLGSAIANWPEEGDGESQLIEAAKQAFMKNRGVVRSQQRYGPEGQRACDLIACPLLVNSKLVAVVSVMISPRSKPQQHAVLQLLQWGGLWMETLLQQLPDGHRYYSRCSLLAG